MEKMIFESIILGRFSISRIFPDDVTFDLDKRLTDRAKAVPLSSPLFYVCLTCIFNELMHGWRHVCVCMCMSMLCLRGGYMFCVTFPA